MTNLFFYDTLDVFFENRLRVYVFKWKSNPLDRIHFENLQSALYKVFEHSAANGDDLLLAMVDNTSPKIEIKKILSMKMLEKWKRINIPHNNYKIVQVVREMTISSKAFVEKMYGQEVPFFTDINLALDYLQNFRKIEESAVIEQAKAAPDLGNEILESANIDKDNLELVAQAARLSNLTTLFDGGRITFEEFSRHQISIFTWYLNHKKRNG